MFNRYLLHHQMRSLKTTQNIRPPQYLWISKYFPYYYYYYIEIQHVKRYTVKIRNNVAILLPRVLPAAHMEELIEDELCKHKLSQIYHTSSYWSR